MLYIETELPGFPERHVIKSDTLYGLVNPAFLSASPDCDADRQNLSLVLTIAGSQPAHADTAYSLVNSLGKSEHAQIATFPMWPEDFSSSSGQDTYYEYLESLSNLMQSMSQRFPAINIVASSIGGVIVTDLIKRLRSSKYNFRNIRSLYLLNTAHGVSDLTVNIGHIREMESRHMQSRKWAGLYDLANQNPDDYFKWIVEFLYHGHGPEEQEAPIRLPQNMNVYFASTSIAYGENENVVVRLPGVDPVIDIFSIFDGERLRAFDSGNVFFRPLAPRDSGTVDGHFVSRGSIRELTASLREAIV